MKPKSPTKATRATEYARAHELAERQCEQQVRHETEIAWRQYEAIKQKESDQ